MICVLPHQAGARFADELGTRDYVTARMIETDPASLLFALVLNRQVHRLTAWTPGSWAYGIAYGRPLGT